MLAKLLLLEDSLVVVDREANRAKVLLRSRPIPIAVVPERRERAILEFVLEATRRHHNVQAAVICRRLPVAVKLHVQLLPVEAEEAARFAKRLDARLRAPLWLVELCQVFICAAVHRLVLFRDLGTILAHRVVLRVHLEERHVIFRSVQEVLDRERHLEGISACCQAVVGVD